jgi:hypothetical protein
MLVYTLQRHSCRDDCIAKGKGRKKKRVYSLVDVVADNETDKR